MSDVETLDAVYGPCPIKRSRRRKVDIKDLDNALFDLLLDPDDSAVFATMTLRQVFYQAVSRGIVDKTEASYKTVGRRILTMRRDGRIPKVGVIADNTRWQRKPRTFSSLEAMLTNARDTYRRSLWEEQDAYVEVWLEKDALAGVLFDVTGPWDVPLMVSRGYASESFLAEAAASIEEVCKPAYLYYFGDYDPSGVNIPHVIERRLRALAPGAEIHFECVAVTPEQIKTWNLPTRPTKKTDTRAKTFGSESVEVDAIPPKNLLDLANNCIVQHLDLQQYKETLKIEELERASLTNMLSSRLRGRKT